MRDSTRVNSVISWTMGTYFLQNRGIERRSTCSLWCYCWSYFLSLKLQFSSHHNALRLNGMRKLTINFVIITTTVINVIIINLSTSPVIIVTISTLIQTILNFINFTKEQRDYNYFNDNTHQNDIFNTEEQIPKTSMDNLGLEFEWTWN